MDDAHCFHFGLNLDVFANDNDGVSNMHIRKDAEQPKDFMNAPYAAVPNSYQSRSTTLNSQPRMPLQLRLCHAWCTGIRVSLDVAGCFALAEEDDCYCKIVPA